MRAYMYNVDGCALRNVTIQNPRIKPNSCDIGYSWWDKWDYIPVIFDGSWSGEDIYEIDAKDWAYGFLGLEDRVPVKLSSRINQIDLVEQSKRLWVDFVETSLRTFGKVRDMKEFAMCYNTVTWSSQDSLSTTFKQLEDIVFYLTFGDISTEWDVAAEAIWQYINCVRNPEWDVKSHPEFINFILHYTDWEENHGIVFEKRAGSNTGERATAKSCPRDLKSAEESGSRKKVTGSKERKTEKREA